MWEKIEQPGAGNRGVCARSGMGHEDQDKGECSSYNGLCMCDTAGEDCKEWVEIELDDEESD